MTEPKPIYDDGTCRSSTNAPDYVAKWNPSINGEPLSTKQLHEVIVSQAITIDRLLGEVGECRARVQELEQERQWVSISESQPEVGEIVSWSHPSWKRAKEGYMTGSGRLKVWGGEYLKIDKLKWQPLPQPPKVLK